MITFYSWIKNQKYRDDDIGDLGKYINSDTTHRKVPKAAAVSEMWLEYLKRIGMDDYMLEAFDNAWEEYKLMEKLELAMDTCRIAMTHGFIAIKDEAIEDDRRIRAINRGYVVNKMDNIEQEFNSIARNAMDALTLIYLRRRARHIKEAKEEQ